MLKELELKERKVVLRKSRVKVTEENYRTLQLLDLLCDIPQYADDDTEDASVKVKNYMLQEGINRTKVDEYVRDYPERIYKNIYEMRLFDVLA